MERSGCYEFRDINVQMFKEIFNKHRGQKSIWIENGVNVGELLKASMPFLIQSSEITGENIISSVMVSYTIINDRGDSKIDSVVVND